MQHRALHLRRSGNQRRAFNLLIIIIGMPGDDNGDDGEEFYGR